MNDCDNPVATTIAAGPNVLLVTHGDYSDYGVDHILLAPAGRNPEEDWKAFTNIVDSRRDERKAGFMAAAKQASQEAISKGIIADSGKDLPDLRAEIASINANRVKLIKGSPGRAALWHRLRVLEKQAKVLDKINTELQLESRRQILKELCEQTGMPYVGPQVGPQAGPQEEYTDWYADQLLMNAAIVAWFTYNGYQQCGVHET